MKARRNIKCVMCNELLKASFIIFCVFTLHITPYALHRSFAEDVSTSGELITKAWDAHGRKDTDATFKYTQQCIDLYKDEADREQAALKELPRGKEEIEKAAALNDVATAYFIQAESYMRQDKPEQAKKVFGLIIAKYPYAQAWDMRGWYWLIKTASEQSIKKLETGSIEIEQKKRVSQLAAKITLYDPGKEDIVDYKKYGEFENIGSKNYKYSIKDQEGLSAAVGEGIYPNTTSARWDPAFKKAREGRRLEGSHWDFLQSPDLQAAFFKWATAPEPAGARLFYTALILEKAGLIKHALKCYYAIVVHYPFSYGWTYWHTPWYMGQAAIAKINFLLQRNPQLGYKLSGADIRVINGYDNDVSNDIFIVSPGKFAKAGPLDKFRPKPKLDLLSIKRRFGKGKVHLLQYETGDWQLMVNGRPYIIKGITYAPTKIGQSPDEGTLGNWMEEDFNVNGKIDGPYDAFVDKNRNNLQDKDEPAVGDFRLMKEMGVNTIRLYHRPLKVNKELLRDLYETYGIRVIMGDFLGKYAIGSGAAWNPGTDYNNEEQKKKMLESVTAMVNEHKDEPYLLFWILGNENVYGYGCNADKQPDAFFKFANEAALRIKELDPEHPVALCNGDLLYLDKFGRDCPDVDIFGANAYRGNYGFGRFWRSVREEADKPAFITEYGCPAYAAGRPVEEQEELQADYLVGSWQDMQNNTAFSGGAGNCIGGVAFEWLDEWWKAYEPKLHDTKGLWTGPFPDGHMHEEWLGFCGQGDGRLSPFLRQLRKAYYAYKKLWR